MKNFRFVLTAVAVLFAFVAAFADMSNEVFVDVDLKRVSNGVCTADQPISSIPQNCSTSNDGAICTIVISEVEYQIHAENSSCLNAYQLP